MYGIRNLPLEGSLNYFYDLVDKNGVIKQRRYYDYNGLPILDIDNTNHGNTKIHPEELHAHDWIHGVRKGRGRKLSDEEIAENMDMLYKFSITKRRDINV